jgi:hypothetical protein
MISCFTVYRSTWGKVVCKFSVLPGPWTPVTFKYFAHNIALRNAPFNRYDKGMCHDEIVDGVADACGNVWELTCFKVSVDHR